MKAFQLKITIRDSHPPIWRRIMVPAGLSFTQLAFVIEKTFGWNGYHLSDFLFEKENLIIKNDQLDDMAPPFSRYSTIDGSQYLIDDFIDKGTTFTFTYDFGDDWKHIIKVEDILTDYDKNYPTLLKFKGNTPPEDCGGIYGYYNLLEILKNPKNESYKDMAEWLGEVKDYDPALVQGELDRLKLGKKKGKGLTRMELYDAFDFPNFEFKQLKSPQKKDCVNLAFNSDEPFDLFSLVEKVNTVKLLLKNTTMTEEEIYVALEFTPLEIQNIRNILKIK